MTEGASFEMSLAGNTAVFLGLTLLFSYNLGAVIAAGPSRQGMFTFFALGMGEADIVVRVANKKTLMPGKVHCTVRVEREDRDGGVTR